MSVSRRRTAQVCRIGEIFGAKARIGLDGWGVFVVAAAKITWDLTNGNALRCMSVWSAFRYTNTRRAANDNSNIRCRLCS
jgi:hypothetical protein